MKIEIGTWHFALESGNQQSAISNRLFKLEIGNWKLEMTMNFAVRLALVGSLAAFLFACGTEYGTDAAPTGTDDGSYHNLGRVIYTRDAAGVLTCAATKSDGSGTTALPIVGEFYAPSRNGMLAYVAYDSLMRISGIAIARFDSGVIARVGPADTIDMSSAQLFPVLSPQRTLVAYTCSYARSSVIHLVGIDGTLDRVLAADAAPFALPSFSPAGDRIAYIGADGTIRIVPVAGGTSITTGKPVNAANALPTSVSWSADGNSLCYARIAGSAVQVCVAPAIGGTEQIIALSETGFGHGHPAWSPDGQWIACEHNDGIWLFRPDASDSMRLASAFDMLDHYPQWSADGSRVFFQRSTLTDMGTTSLYSVDLATKTTTHIADNLSLFNGMEVGEW